MASNTCRTRLHSHGNVRALIRLWLQALTLASLLIGLSLGAAAAHGTPHRAAHVRAHVHVYFLRGFLNIFSLGMDRMAARLERQGIRATVYNHLLWPLVAQEAAAEYKSGQVRTIILVGHSAGADAVDYICAQLGALGIPVKLAIDLDPSLSHMPATGHVDRFIVYYVSSGIGHPIGRGRQFRGRLENINVSNIPGIGHFTIDKNAVMEDKVMRDIHAAL